MLQYHAEVRSCFGLRVEEGIPKEKQIPDEKGLRPLATLRAFGSYQVFSVIIKDVCLLLPIESWGKMLTMRTEVETLCYPPADAVESCPGSYLAFEVRLPNLVIGETQEITLLGAKKRHAMGDVGNPERYWADRWREHFGCEPPVSAAEAEIWEIYTRETPCTDIVFTN